LLALIRFADGELTCLDFGQPIEPRLTVEEHVRHILADFETRRVELIDIGFQDAVAALIEILKTAGDDLTSLLPPVKALGYLGRPQGAPAVTAHIGHADRAVRLAVIRSLGQMGKFESIPVIEPFLRSPDRRERREAIMALGKFAKPEVVAEMESAAGQDAEFRRLVEEARRRVDATVHGIDTGDFAPFADALIDTDEYEDILALLMMCWPPVKQILGGHTRSFETRRRALFLLSCGAMSQAIPEMRTVLDDAGELLPMRLEAIYGLGRTRARSVVPQLIELMDSGETATRDTTIEALGRIGDARALEPLLRKWRAEEPGLRPQLRLAMSRLCATPGLAALLEPLRSYQPRAIADIYFIDDSLELFSGYRRDRIAPLFGSPLPAARRDALLLLATLGAKDDNETLQSSRDADSDPLNREIADLGIERLKDIPLWERP
jgi:HEAT repeat protein